MESFTRLNECIGRFRTNRPTVAEQTLISQALSGAIKTVVDAHAQQIAVKGIPHDGKVLEPHVCRQFGSVANDGTLFILGDPAGRRS
jgi:hypothetical protein